MREDEGSGSRENEKMKIGGLAHFLPTVPLNQTNDNEKTTAEYHRPTTTTTKCTAPRKCPPQPPPHQQIPITFHQPVVFAATLSSAPPVSSKSSLSNGWITTG